MLRHVIVYMQFEIVCGLEPKTKQKHYQINVLFMKGEINVLMLDALSVVFIFPNHTTRSKTPESGE